MPPPDSVREFFTRSLRRSFSDSSSPGLLPGQLSAVSPAGKGTPARGVATRLSWHILGGNNRHHIGANAGLCVYEDTGADGRPRRQALLFDIGSLPGDARAAEDPALAESDTIIPDITPYLYKKDDPQHVPETPLSSIYLTHSHADHLGALPFLLLMGYCLPKIYATPYTAKRLQQELLAAGIAPADWPPIFMIAPGKTIEEGPVKVTAFWVSHSTPQSAGFFIETPEGNILNPGDFKLDQSVLWGPAFSETQFNRIIAGKKVDVLLLDSTGADRNVKPVTEADVRRSLDEVMKANPGKRVIIAVMSGFEENMASAVRVAAENGRDVWVAGWSHEQSLDALAATGMTLQDHLGLSAKLRVLASGRSARDLAAAPPGKSVVIVTGAQGRTGAALTRAVEGTHNALSLDPKKDIVLFCAPMIPGQEAGRFRLFSLLRQKGLSFLTREDKPLYAHAHARLSELKKMVKMANPLAIVPIHGGERLRATCAKAFEKEGRKVSMANNGDTLQISRTKGVKVLSSASHRPAFIGFKTLTGGNWQDRYYMMTRTAGLPPIPANDTPSRPLPRIFDISRK